MNLHDGIRTEELDRISANVAESLKLVHPDYSILAARILISNLHKTTPDRFSTCIAFLAEKLEVLDPVCCVFIAEHAATLDAMIIDDNDYLFDYFGYKTLEHAYLMKVDQPVLGTDGLPIYEDANGVAHTPTHESRRGTPLAECDGATVALRPRVEKRVADRPQYIFMRVAIGIYMGSSQDAQTVLSNIHHCYKMLSELYFTHATPTLFNACTASGQLLSCFLCSTKDSIEEIHRTLTNTALISKKAGGIGVHMHGIRCLGSLIKGTNGPSSGLPKQLKIYNESARCWDQGGKRKGAFAIYIEPWHGDIMRFLCMKLAQGLDTERARDLFYALWVPDLFVQRARQGHQWSLFSEHTAYGLSSVYDGMDVCTKCGYCDNIDVTNMMKNPNAIEFRDIFGDPAKHAGCSGHIFAPRDVFTELYTTYESEGLAVSALPAREILDAVFKMQRESGTPYICFKDHVNRMSNQKNIGTIKSSNLCTEIMEWSSADSYACCTLASINLRKYLVKDANGRLTFDHERLHAVVRLITRNLDLVVDNNKYPVPECEGNSRDYRPIGIGIQGLADIFALMRIPFLSPEADTLDLEIAETIYHAAITESVARARECGPYKAFAGSPASRGLLHPELWAANQQRIGGPFAGVNVYSGRYDMDALRADVVQYGLRNSLHIAFMPTVSTSQILGNNESFEPFDANIYAKGTLAGKFTVTNNAMIRHLVELGLWNETIKNKIIAAGGSVQGIAEIPASVRAIYATVWELSQRDLMKRAAIRAAFVDQSSSLNIHLSNNSDAALRSVFINGWDLGLPTGSYYIRTKPAAEAMINNAAVVREIKVDTTSDSNAASDLPEGGVCRMEAGCVMCSS
jgi:ribonucleoside-diphosphate reductase alpha chain